jgi:hypothetical protein
MEHSQKKILEEKGNRSLYVLRRQIVLYFASWISCFDMEVQDDMQANHRSRNVVWALSSTYKNTITHKNVISVRGHLSVLYFSLSRCTNTAKHLELDFFSCVHVLDSTHRLERIIMVHLDYELKRVSSFCRRGGCKHLRMLWCVMLFGGVTNPQ